MLTTASQKENFCGIYNKENHLTLFNGSHNSSNNNNVPEENEKRT